MTIKYTKFDQGGIKDAKNGNLHTSESLQQLYEDEFSTHEEREQKKGGSSFCPIEYRYYPAHKTADNAKAYNLFGLDIENDAKAKKLLSYDAVAEILKECNQESFLYTTFNHTEELPRFRAVISFNRPLKPEDLAIFYHALLESLGLKDHPAIDNCVEHISQMLYPPSCPPKRLDIARSDFIEGEPLDVDALLREAAEEIPLSILQQFRGCIRKQTGPKWPGFEDWLKTKTEYKKIKKDGYTVYKVPCLYNLTKDHNDSTKHKVEKHKDAYFSQADTGEVYFKCYHDSCELSRSKEGDHLKKFLSVVDKEMYRIRYGYTFAELEMQTEELKEEYVFYNKNDKPYLNPNVTLEEVIRSVHKVTDAMARSTLTPAQQDGLFGLLNEATAKKVTKTALKGNRPSEHVIPESLRSA